MGTTSVINPFSSNVIAQVEIQSEALAMEKIQNAYNYYINKSSWIKKNQRIEIIKKAQSIFLSKKEQVIDLAIKEGGKPLKDSLIEFDRALLTFDLAIHELFSGDRTHTIPMELSEGSLNRHAFTVTEPRGVVLALSAFNHPINLAAHQIIPAIAQGCPVVFKPSFKTPLSPKILVDSFIEAGLPENLCQYLVIENDVVQKLVQHPKLGFLSFIGSAKVGWYLRSKLAPGAHCTLEHGGVAATIIDEGYNVKNIAHGLVKSAFYHAGQVCISLQRLFVHESIYDKLVENLLLEAKKLKTGNPLDIDTDVGPLISPTEVSRVDMWVKEALEKGGKLLLGGQKLSNSLYPPTILTNPSFDSRISYEEIFGPVLAIYTFSNLEEALGKINNNNYHFQASIFSNNINKACYLAHNINATSVMINDFSTFRVDWMPFYGHGLAGLGKQGIKYAMKELSIEKLLVFKYQL